MTSTPFGNLEARLPSNNPSALSARSIRNPPLSPHPGPRFADFHFKTIGQQPELLKRISAPNPDTQYDHHSGLLSPSSLLSDQDVMTPALPESDGAKRPSLQDRLSLLESPTTEKDDVDLTMANPQEIRPAFESTHVSPVTTQPYRRRSDSSRSPEDSRGTLQNHGLGKEPDLSHIIGTNGQGVTSSSNESRFPIIMPSFDTHARLSPPLGQTGLCGVSTPFSSGEDTHSLMVLRALQSRLSSSLSNFNPISTTNALAAAQSAKDQSTEILATAHRAHTLAQQASSLAQDSMVAAQDCLNLAATMQNKTDLALSAVENIRSGQGISPEGEWEYNATVKALKDDLHQLAEWVRQRDAYESKRLRQFEEVESEKRQKKLALELKKFSADKQLHESNTHSNSSGTQTSIHQAGALTAEDEADAATRAWNQHREQSVERRRLAEDELRKHREAEVELERKRLQAQSDVDAHEAELEKLRAERFKAEEEEKSRQEMEALALQRRQQVLEIGRFLLNQKQAQDDLAKIAAEEKKKAGAEKEARLIAEHEQKRREIHEKEIQKRQEAEKAKASLLAESETRRRDKIMERMKHLVAEAQTSVDNVTNILGKAKEKQSRATLTTDNHTSPSQDLPLPLLPTHQVSGLSNPNAEFGNIVAKKTLLTDGPQTSIQQNNLSGSTRLGESSNALNLTSSTSSALKSSTPMQNGAKSHDVTPTIPSSVNKPPLSDNPAFGTSSRIHEVNGKSGDGICNVGPLKLPISLSPLDESPLDEGSSSLPVSTLPLHTPNPPATSLNGFENIHHAGSISVVPLSRVLPIPVEAQRANLRPFMDANGISYGRGTSDVDNQNSSADQPSAATERPPGKLPPSSQTQEDQMCIANKLKVEPLNDVPILSLPSPPADTTDITAAFPTKLADFRKIKTAPLMTATETSLSPREPPASAQTMPSSEPPVQSSGLTVSPLVGPSLTNSSIVSKSKEKRPAAVRRNVPPLASNEQISIPADTNLQTNYRSVSPRMGPDAAVTDGWAQPGVDDLVAKNPRKQLPRNVDHFSPPRHLPPKRPRGLPPRTNDHYSPPRRIPDSSQNYSRDRRRSGSVEYGFSPPQPKYRSLSPEDTVNTGRKRYRNDESVDAPPPRRYRYDSPPIRQDEYIQPPTDADWNHTANFGRSPSPVPRQTPLALRLESEKRGSSYRLAYNDIPSYAYDPQSRNNKNQRYSAPHFQSILQGSNYYGDAFAQSNQQRQFARGDIADDTRLPLLSRFTDSTEQIPPAFSDHHGPTRPRPRSRGGGNQAVGHRNLKSKSGSLISRLEDAN